MQDRHSLIRAVERFWAKVDHENGPLIVGMETPCWIWCAARDDYGHGAVRILGRLMKAHRVSWLLKRGKIGDLCVLHRCDVPSCVNPDHLFLGTKADNTADMYAKGRARPGGDAVKLNPGDVREIRTAAAAGESQYSIAARLEVSQSAVSAVLMGRSWAGVP